MKQGKDLKSPERRDFFRKAGLGIGAAGAVAATSAGQAQAAVHEDRGFKKSQYRETEHVRRAYDLSRF